MNIFLDANHELRPGWKFVSYAAILFFFFIAMQVAVSMYYQSRDLPDEPLSVLALTAVVGFIPSVAALLLAVRFIDHRPLRTFGIGLFPGWSWNLASGLAMGGVMAVAVIVGCYAIGYVSMAWTGGQSTFGTLLATFIVLMIAAANEELVFRGFPLQLLVEAMGEWPAAIGLSALFGLLHINNPNASWLGIVNTVLAGMLLSLAYIRTRSLWFPYGIHLSWNAGLGFIFGFPLSGLDLASLWTTGIAGSDTILGGGYGPEGGLLATFIFGASAVVVQRRKSPKREGTDR